MKGKYGTWEPEKETNLACIEAYSGLYSAVELFYEKPTKHLRKLNSQQNFDPQDKQWVELKYCFLLAMKRFPFMYLTLASNTYSSQ